MADVVESAEVNAAGEAEEERSPTEEPPAKEAPAADEAAEQAEEEAEEAEADAAEPPAEAGKAAGTAASADGGGAKVAAQAAKAAPSVKQEHLAVSVVVAQKDAGGDVWIDSDDEVPAEPVPPKKQKGCTKKSGGGTPAAAPSASLPATHDDLPGEKENTCNLCGKFIKPEDLSVQGRDGCIRMHKHCRNAKLSWDREVKNLPDEQRSAILEATSKNQDMVNQHIANNAEEALKSGLKKRGKREIAKMKQAMEELITFTRVVRIKDAVLLGQRQHRAFYRFWYAYNDQEAAEQWVHDRNTKKTEVEDGELKVWVREPTRLRGETGVERRGTIRQQTSLETPEEEQQAKKRMRKGALLTDRAFGHDAKLFEGGSMSTALHADQPVDDGDRSDSEMSLDFFAEEAAPEAAPPAALGGQTAKPPVAAAASAALPESAPAGLAGDGPLARKPQPQRLDTPGGPDTAAAAAELASSSSGPAAEVPAPASKANVGAGDATGAGAAGARAKRMSPKEFLAAKRKFASECKEAMNKISAAKTGLTPVLKDLVERVGKSDAIELLDVTPTQTQLATTLASFKSLETESSKTSKEAWTQLEEKFEKAKEGFAELCETVNEIIEALKEEVKQKKADTKRNKNSEYHELKKFSDAMVNGGWPAKLAREVARVVKGTEGKPGKSEALMAEESIAAAIATFEEQNSAEFQRRHATLKDMMSSKAPTTIMMRLTGLPLHSFHGSSDTIQELLTPWTLHWCRLAWKFGPAYTPLTGLMEQFWKCSHQFILVLIPAIVLQGCAVADLMTKTLDAVEPATWKTICASEDVLIIEVAADAVVRVPAGTVPLPIFAPDADPQVRGFLTVYPRYSKEEQANACVVRDVNFCAKSLGSFLSNPKAQAATPWSYLVKAWGVFSEQLST